MNFSNIFGIISNSESKTAEETAYEYTDEARQTNELLYKKMKSRM